MGLHGQAIATTIEMMADLRRIDPVVDDVARRLGIVPDDLRRIFPSDQELLFAVAEQALVRLMDSCTKAVVRVHPDDAVGQFLALGKAYVRWAAEHRMQFRLISGHPTLNALQHPALRRYRDAIVDLMTRMLERARSAGLLRPDEDIGMIVLSSETFAYGLAHMVVDGRMKELSPSGDPVETAEMAMADFVTRFARTAAWQPARDAKAASGKP